MKSPTSAPAAFPGFSSEGIAVWDGFLSATQTRALLDSAVRRRAQGEFKAARIGSGRGLHRREEFRGDSTCWLDTPLSAAEDGFLAAIEDLRLTLNRESFLGLFALELHYACYPPGAGYARHLDQLHGRTQRKVSMIVYLNDAWEACDGGELRLFEDGGRHRDIAPLAGRLVCFLTQGREHSVLPTRVDRFSVSGWLSVRAP